MNSQNNRRPLIIFLLASIFAYYVAENIYGNVFNNYLDVVQKIDTRARGLLEFPRELPGFLSVFAISALYFLSEGAIAVVACFLLAIGLVALTIPGFASNYWLLCLWISVASFGQHFFLTIVDAIVLHTAAPEKRSLRLGQMKSVVTAGSLAAAVFVWLKWKYLNQNFNVDFLVAATFAAIAGLILLTMRPAGTFQKCTHWKERLILRRKYSLYYILEALFGARKQVFLTFGIWLLVFTLGQSAEYIGILMFISGVIGLFFRPLVGKMIQIYGERLALLAESVMIVVVCLGYALALRIFERNTAITVLSACFVIDASLFAFGMARASYIARTVDRREELTPSLYSGMAINHVTSILAAILGGLLWKVTGDHMWVFLFAAGLGVYYGYYANRVKQPDEEGL